MSDPKQVKITMLGTSGAGKTCYMLGMYDAMKLGVPKTPFSLVTHEPDLDLKLEALWQKLVEETGRDRWPPPTPDDPQTYAFYFCYALKAMISFDWMDYRGGAMSDTSSKADTQALRDRLRQSDCVFLCVSGELLREATNDTQLRAKARQAKINNMTSYLVDLAQTVNPSDENPYPIVITITKYDYCRHRSKEEIIADVKAMFAPLFIPDSGWLVMICPVTLGRDLAADGEKGEIDPKNVHLPLVFALYANFYQFYQAEQTARDQSRNRVTALKQDNVFARWLNSDGINRGIEEITRSENKMKELEQKMLLLKQELSTAMIFLSGKEIEI